ncbi:hypothetical protein H8L32_01570 [Undibacterium sp. CY18W]|uniref:Uncharacterized protein n=1 Tax=Undibacterium hunanense TaxID=2762292 RepID=A0ABR6ZJW3_9BURK|nr:hypothetical protein [Undibacterium hunanense]
MELALKNTNKFEKIHLSLAALSAAISIFTAPKQYLPQIRDKSTGFSIASKHADSLSGSRGNQSTKN